jgi:hypothetical protein
LKLHDLSIVVPVAIQAAAPHQPERADGRRPFAMFAYTGEPLMLPRFDLPVVIDCASLDLTAQSIPALLEHMPYMDTVVGQIESIEVAGPANTPPVMAYGYFTPTDDPKDAATFVMKKADAGFKWQASVGGNPSRVDRIEAGQTVAVNGRTYAGPCYVARGTHFREISFTVLGADRRTSVSASVQSDPEDFDSWLLKLGFEDSGELSPVQLANLSMRHRGFIWMKVADESKLDLETYCLTFGFEPGELDPIQSANFELRRQGFALVNTRLGESCTLDSAPTNA